MRASASAPRSGPIAHTTNTPSYPTAEATTPSVSDPTRKPTSVKAVNVPTTELLSLSGAAFTASVMSEGNASAWPKPTITRSEEHTSELQSLRHLVCRLLLEKKK